MTRVLQWLVGMWLLGAPALAASPLVVVHPLEESQVSARGLVQDRASLVLSALDAKVRMVDPQKVQPLLEALPGQSCQGKPECLAGLAAKTTADAALYVNVNTYAPEVKVFWKLVSADGNTVRSGSFDQKKSGTHRSKWVSTALERLFTVALSGELEAFTPEAKAVTAAPLGPADGPKTEGEPPVQPPVKPEGTARLAPSADPAGTGGVGPHVSEPGGGWIRPVAIGAGAVGVAGMVAGVLLGRSARTGWEDALQKAGPLPSPEAAEALQVQRDSFRGRVDLGNALLVGGGVALAAGAGLFTYDLLRPRAPIRVAVGAGPRALWVSGRF